ncbi:hypothetical protein JQC79_19300 [Ochrobactrum anthropi]|nr:hypothetical protein [Brucella anthropi]MBM6397901.1 hypothetical protein [Brucella anthropi]
MDERERTTDSKEPKYVYGKPLTFFEAELFAVIFKFCQALKSAFVKR